MNGRHRHSRRPARVARRYARHMLRRYRGLVLGMAGVLGTGLAGLIPAWNSLGCWRWVIVAAMVVSVTALVIQQGDMGAKNVPFTEADWKSDAGGGYELRIPYRQHGRKHPNCDVYMVDTDGDLVQVHCGQTRDGSDVLIHIGVQPINGEAHIH